MLEFLAATQQSLSMKVHSASLSARRIEKPNIVIVLPPILWLLCSNMALRCADAGGALVTGYEYVHLYLYPRHTGYCI